MNTHSSDPGARGPRRRKWGETGSYVYASLATVAAFALAFVLARYLSVANLALIFLTAVLVVAVRSRMRVAVYTAAWCFLGYNFFFTPPRYTFAIESAGDVLTVVLFLIVALVCSRLATQLADKVVSLRKAKERARVLLDLGKRLAASNDIDVLRGVAVEVTSKALGTMSAMLVRDVRAGGWIVAAAAPHPPVLGDAEIAAADLCDRLVEPAGHGTRRALEAGIWALPLFVESQRHGVLALASGGGRSDLEEEQRNLAEAMAREIADALERARLAAALESARVEGEAERLRGALLSSVSHDLRSPLASMIGAADTLSNYASNLSVEERNELLGTILGEGKRLDRYIQNLLDMTRLGHGEMKLHRDWLDATEIAAGAIERLRRLFPQQQVETKWPHEAVLLYVHPALIEQALFNILENAAHFSPVDTPIHVCVEPGDRQLHIDVIDHGPGIPPEDRERIFDKFYSVARGDRGTRGTGLGLSICQGLVGAHGGQVVALPAQGGGSILRITLPLPEMPEVDA